jgi:hypothetical protein
MPIPWPRVIKRLRNWDRKYSDLWETIECAYLLVCELRDNGYGGPLELWIDRNHDAVVMEFKDCDYHVSYWVFGREGIELSHWLKGRLAKRQHIREDIKSRT